MTFQGKAAFPIIITDGAEEYLRSPDSLSSFKTGVIILDKSSGHGAQEIKIHYRFDIAVTTAVADSMKYGNMIVSCKK